MLSKFLSAVHILRLLIFYGGYYLILACWALSVLTIAIWIPLRRRIFFCLIFYRIYEAWLKLCLNIRIHYEYESPLPEDENYIIMANHQAEWEAFAFSCMRRPAITVLKRELMGLPLFGWAMAWFNPIVVDRTNSIKSMKRIYQQGKKYLNQGYNLVIFPQGGRIPPPHLEKFYPGSERLAFETGKSILLIAHNSGQSMPKYFVGGYAGTIYVKVAAPISPHNHNKSSLHRQIIDTMERMMKEVHSFAK